MAWSRIFYTKVEHEETRDLKLVFDWVGSGTRRVDFWDTDTGERVSSVAGEADGGRMTVPVPPFTRDVAFRFEAE